ncbi:type II secretion system major pseudopilin GspG [Aminivibrio sp.]|jgi:general secretion pathway protein G|uniref:type II secretion system major pseudopilin GspG n=1 Tax=Aminivibrio sp. TaxID=1872489 RepID=UPI00345E1721|nr:type II secretion system major pseudopilin GspG [Synergistaceae bacterium]MDD4612953.1 type II secretion system major pseudopilin GspG [Synergistaceae bacterium]
MKKSMRKRRGFTLVEVLVVVVILGLLAALVVPRVVGRGEEAKRTAASVQIREIEQALEMYRLDSSMYPTTAQGLEALVVKPSIPPEPRKYREGGYLRKLPSDPWGSPFVYRQPGDHGEYDLFSPGADGEEGGDGAGKDITNWE